ncbi:CDK2, putative [Entamoeba invadens IP1]|uniref:CDK2, putative n=1 Tax=Entamoeba invadens IP1 TaxID=370355 RepID=UPI0002C3E3EF|nr:CDK2, putative [Entamoeba invadens IP1]ELP94083.1 CDK2, putative [Entamoeba invadens IP1]|eukprot:XP_004260854.1 CDK2, putative [Entamoeba invadens IP1]
MSRYQKQQTLGEGTYGVVCKAYDTKEGRNVALKKIKQEREEDGIPVTSVHEIAVLLDLKHPNIVNLYDIYLEDKFLYLVFEYCDQDLYQFIANKTQKLNMNEIRPIVYQILEGLAFCHHHEILHRDMKPQNILINQNGSIKLGDFGLARLTTINDKAYTLEVVTLWYRAPEILLGALKYDGSIDIWSTAAIFGELIKQEELFKGRCKIDQLFKIFSQLGTPTEESWPGISSLQYYLRSFPSFRPKEFTSIFRADKDAVDLLQKMFVYNPAKRITAAQALKHPFFNVLNNQM